MKRAGLDPNQIKQLTELIHGTKLEGITSQELLSFVDKNCGDDMDCTLEFRVIGSQAEVN